MFSVTATPKRESKAKYKPDPEVRRLLVALSKMPVEKRHRYERKCWCCDRRMSMDEGMFVNTYILRNTRTVRELRYHFTHVLMCRRCEKRYKK